MEDRLLSLVSDVHGLLDIGELREGLLPAVTRAIPADWVSLNDIGPGPADVFAVVRPEMGPEDVAVFARYAHQNPLLDYWTRTRDGRAYRFSDLVSQEELEALDLYREFYGRHGIRFQMSITLPSEPDRVLAIVLSRRERDFTDGERDLLNRARPFLIQAYRNAIAFAGRGGGAPAVVVEALVRTGLTEREAEVVHAVARGGSNRDVATSLDISERTVQKHLERAFRKLGVATRSAAAKRVWDLAG